MLLVARAETARHLFVTACALHALEPVTAGVTLLQGSGNSCRDSADDTSLCCFFWSKLRIICSKRGAPAGRLSRPGRAAPILWLQRPVFCWTKLYILGQEVHSAMQARGFRGEVYLLDDPQIRSADGAFLAGFLRCCRHCWSGWGDNALGGSEICILSPECLVRVQERPALNGVSLEDEKGRAGCASWPERFGQIDLVAALGGSGLCATRRDDYSTVKALSEARFSDEEFSMQLPATGRYRFPESGRSALQCKRARGGRLRAAPNALAQEQKVRRALRPFSLS